MPKIKIGIPFRSNILFNKDKEQVLRGLKNSNEYEIICMDWRYTPTNPKAFFDSFPDFHKTYLKENKIDVEYVNGLSLERTVNKYLTRVNAIFIPGNSFDPIIEDQSNHPSKTDTRISPDPRRYHFEKEIIKQCREKGIPVLAVCGGSWVLASAYGAKNKILKGHERVRHETRDFFKAAHEVEVMPGTILNGIVDNASNWKISQSSENEKKYQLSPHINLSLFVEKPLNVKKSLNVCSTHRWVVDEKTMNNPNLIVNARCSKDQHIEGTESKHGVPQIGVQFHPEFAPPYLDHEVNKNFPAQRRIIHTFLESAATHRNKNLVNREISSRHREEEEQDQNNNMPLLRSRL